MSGPPPAKGLLFSLSSKIKKGSQSSIGGSGDGKETSGGEAGGGEAGGGEAGGRNCGSEGMGGEDRRVIGGGGGSPLREGLGFFEIRC
jgi:hypothetical protein